MIVDHSIDSAVIEVFRFDGASIVGKCQRSDAFHSDGLIKDLRRAPLFFLFFFFLFFFFLLLSLPLGLNGILNLITRHESNVFLNRIMQSETRGYNHAYSSVDGQTDR